MHLTRFNTKACALLHTTLPAHRCCGKPDRVWAERRSVWPEDCRDGI